MHLKIKLFISLLVITGFLSTGDCEQSQTPGSIDVAVFCDYECSRIFHHNKSDIDRYVTAIFWDANISFKTLTLSNIFFHVSSVTQISNRKFQPFIEKARNEDGSVVLAEMLTDTKKLFYEQTEFLPSKSFHVGLLITGEKGLDQNFIAEQGSLCDIDHENKIFHSTAILRVGSHSQNYCSSLAGALGITLGIPPPKTQHHKFLACQDKSYIDTYQCGTHHFFFSKCADKQISNFLESQDCLSKKRKMDNYQNDIKNLPSFPSAPSIADQCKLHYNSNSIYTKQDEENCQTTKCYTSKYWISDEYIGDIYPISGTPCGNSKICFRGRCIFKGYRLANVATKTCLATDTNFDSNDKPRLINCPSFTTPLDQFRFISNSKDNFFIATPFSTLDANENEDKCLSVDLSGENLTFRPCRFEHKSWLEWKFYGSSEDEFTPEFMLYHPKTKNCLVVDDDTKNLMITTSCVDDDHSNWKIFEYESPMKTNVKIGYNDTFEGLMDKLIEYSKSVIVVLAIYVYFILFK